MLFHEDFDTLNNLKLCFPEKSFKDRIYVHLKLKL